MNILLSNLLIILSVTSICHGVKCNFSFREDIDNYPERTINRIVSRKKVSFYNRSSGDSREFVCDDDDSTDEGESVGVPTRLHFNHVNKNARPSFRKPIDIDSRFGTTDASSGALPMDDDEEFSDPICSTFTSKIYPKTLPNILNKIVIVVNHGKFRQEVTIEKCSNASQPCNFSDNFPFSVTTKCKQKYLSQTLKVLSEDDQKIIDESVYYPSGCECRIFTSKKPSRYN